jgi:hypothetical protein
MENLLITKELRIDVSEYPDCDIRETTPKDSKEIKDDKKLRPFILNNSISISCVYYTEISGICNNPLLFDFNITKGFTWDGATIPRILWPLIGGKGSPEFLIASLLHDLCCQNKYILNGNRYLSSLILKEVLIACGTPKWKAGIMFVSVDLFQRTQGWDKYIKVNKQ